MPHRFCAICGKDLNDDSPHFGMCVSCFLKENPLFELPKSLTFKICLDCGSFTRKEDWIQVENENVFSTVKIAISRYLLKNYLKSEKINFSIDYDKNSFIYSSKELLSSLDARIRGKLKENEKISNEQKVKVHINYDLCENCLNLRGGRYFQSILQLRVVNEKHFDLIKEVIDNIHNYAEKLFREDNRQYISKVIDQKFGVDLLLSSKELLNHIISNLRSNYHFLLVRTKKLVGRDSQKGKNLYRQKALIKFLPFRKNDEIEIENQKYNVEKIIKNKVILRDKSNLKLVKSFSFFFNDNIGLRKVHDVILEKEE